MSKKERHTRKQMGLEEINFTYMWTKMSLIVFSNTLTKLELFRSTCEDDVLLYSCCKAVTQFVLST